MSSQFTRSSYDQNKTNNDFIQSTKAGYLTLTTIQEPPNQCHSLHGPRNTRTGTSSELGTKYKDSIQIESMLKGLGGDLSRNLDINSSIKRDISLIDKYEKMPKTTVNTCSTFLDVNHTRLNPNDKLQEKPWNRYEYQIQDPMSKYFDGFVSTNKLNNTHGNNRQGISTRYESKVLLEEKNKAFRKIAGKIQGQLSPK